MRYRKLPGRIHQQWHNQPSCPEWPESGYMEHAKPKAKVICLHCASLTKLEAKPPRAKKADKQ